MRLALLPLLLLLFLHLLLLLPPSLPSPTPSSLPSPSPITLDIIRPSNGYARRRRYLIVALQTPPASPAPHFLATFNGSHHLSPLTPSSLVDYPIDYVRLTCDSHDFFPYPPTATFTDDAHLQRPGFLLPFFAKHQHVGVSHFIRSLPASIAHTDDPLLVVLVLSGQFGTTIANHSTPTSFSSCTLHLPDPSDQRHFPVSTLLDANQQPLPTHVPLEPLLPTRDMHVFVDVFGEGTHPAGDAATCAELLAVQAVHRAQRANEPVVNSFMQVQGFLTFVGGAVKKMAGIVLADVMGVAGRHIANTMQQEGGAACVARVPPQVIELAEYPMKVNTSNLIVDVVTYRINKILSDSLVNSIGPPVAEKVAEVVIPQLHSTLQPLLTDVVSDDLIRIIPPIVQRSLKIELTNRLTRVLSHALVPSVTNAVQATRAPKQNIEYCMQCYYKGKFCARCRFSGTALYFMQYYSAYYCDYYANYHSTYYTHAMILQDSYWDFESYPEAVVAAARGEASFLETASSAVNWRNRYEHAHPPRRRS